MFRFFVLFYILLVSLYALSDSAILKRADGFMRTNSKSDQFRAYNDYKNLYLRSMMSEDKALQINALKGIVKSGTKLHIDVSQYAKELSTLKPKSVYKKKQKINAYIPHQKTKSTKNIKIKSSHKLKYAKFENEKLVLKFDKRLSKKQIKYFTMYDSRKKRFKYIFDISKSMITTSKSLRKVGIKRIRLAQFNTTTIRLVIEDDKRLKIRYTRDSNKLVIGINDSVKIVKSTKKEYQQIPPRLDRDKIIMIDAGHGGKDPGAVGYKNYREKTVVLQIAKQLKAILKSRGYKVYMTRDRNVFVKLSHRTKYANKKNADIFISIHANAVPKKNAKKAHGIECYFLSKSRSSRAKRVAEKENSADLSDMNFYGKESFLNTLNSHNIVASNKLAIDLQRGMLGSLKKSYKGVYDGGVREGPFWVLVGAQMPSVLVEVGFITNPTEAKRLVSSRYQKKLAYGLANGVERYFANNTSSY
jgi:N-acetylmuramoyl-L-alanine amidase